MRSPSAQSTRIIHAMRSTLTWSSVVLLVACTASSSSERSADAHVASSTPARVAPLPAGVLLEVAFPETRIVDRFTDDGRWLRSRDGGPMEQQTPLPQRPRGPLLPPGGVQRLRDAVASALRADLPGRTPASPALRSGRSRLTGGRRVSLGTVRVTFPGGKGGALAVEVECDVRAPGTCGPLAKLLGQVDREAYGTFMNE